MISLLNKKVFVVDDDALVLKSMTRKLSLWGFNDIETFDNGYDCIAAISKQPFVVLLDYQMDGLNGQEVLSKIKRYNPNTYVIMLSSQVDVTNAVETLKYGAFDYIVKGNQDEQKLESALNRIEKLEALTLVPRRTLFTKIFKLA